MHRVVAVVSGVVGAGDFTDPTNSRVIYLAVAGLVLLGLAVLVGSIIWWRAARVEHPALGPLEEMSSRAWWKGDFTERQRRLERTRQRLAAADSPVSAAEPVDLEALVKSVPTGFDDLIEELDMAIGDVPDGSADPTDAEPIPEPIDPLLRFDAAE